MVAKLNPLLKSQLQKQSAPRLAKIAELSEFYDDLSKLNELAYGITEPGSDTDWLDAPVYLHGIRLRSLSLGAYLWVQKRALAWFPADKMAFWANVSIAYAMSLSRKPKRLFCIRDAESCKTALNHWMRDCGCTYAELVDAIDKILNNQGASQDSESGATSSSEYGPVIALLGSEYGYSADDVLWGMSLDQVQGLCDEYIAKMREQEAARSGKGHKPSSEAYKRACGTFFKALNTFRQKVEAIDG